MIAAEEIEYLCQQAEAFAGEVYKPIRQQLSAWGGKGGKRSRRGKSFNMPPIEGLERMTKTEQVQAVMASTGCSESPAWRRLRELSTKPLSKNEN